MPGSSVKASSLLLVSKSKGGPSEVPLICEVRGGGRRDSERLGERKKRDGGGKKEEG
jgi:hypothetical protein